MDSITTLEFIKEDNNIISDLVKLHPEECGNQKLNTAIKEGFEDIKKIDTNIKELGTKVNNLLTHNLNRLDSVLNIITAEKERLQDISMLCNSKTDFDNAFILTDYNFSGEYSYDNGVFSAKLLQSSKVKADVIEVTGNGYEGNKYVRKDTGYLEDVLNTKSKSYMVDNNITTCWEYSRITAANTEPYLISDFNTDSSEAKSTVTIKFNQVSNEIAIKSTLDSLKVVGIKHSMDGITYKDLDMLPFKLNNKEESYKKYEYIYGSNIVAFPNAMYLKITFESTTYLNEAISFERVITEEDKTSVLTTIVPTAKRHVIRVNNLECNRKQYVKSNLFKTDELINSEKADVYAISIFANVYLPEGTTPDYIKFTLTVNGTDYEIVPINSHLNGVKVIRFSQGKLPAEYTKYIGEKISSAKLTITMKANSNVTPYINNIKVLLGGEV